jgi:hypothetical protein
MVCENRKHGKHRDDATLVKWAFYKSFSASLASRGKAWWWNLPIEWIVPAERVVRSRQRDIPIRGVRPITKTQDVFGTCWQDLGDLGELDLDHREAGFFCVC